jgi:hypothetical protein
MGSTLSGALCCTILLLKVEKASTERAWAIGTLYRPLFCCMTAVKLRTLRSQLSLCKREETGMDDQEQPRILCLFVQCKLESEFLDRRMLTLG